MYSFRCSNCQKVWLKPIIILIIPLLFIYCKSVKQNSNDNPIIPTDTLIVQQLDPPNGTSGHFNALRFINGVLYIVGENGLIAKGIPGNEFMLHYHPYGVTFWEILDVRDAILVFGSFGTIYRTTDGVNWVTVTLDSMAFGLCYRKAAIDGANRIWALGENTLIHYSTDNGITWNMVDHHNLIRYRDYTAIAFFPNGRGYLTTSTVGFWTTNNGVSWQGIRGINNSTNHILFLSSSELMLACNSGTILRSYDFGYSFQPANLIDVTQESINKVIQLGDRTFLAVSAYLDSNEQRRGKVWRSINGNDWWSIYQTQEEIRDITLGPDGTILICGTNRFLASIVRN